MSGGQAQGRVLIVAGSDSGGGAGVQGDIKAVTVLGGYAASAITALTAQNTLGVFGIHDIPAAFVVRQMEVVLSDIGADAIKTGMLHNAALIDVVCDVIESKAPDVPVVVDPVMVAKGGAVLLEPSARATLKRRLAFLATILTPNVPEAETLTGMTIGDLDTMRRAAEVLLTIGPQAVLLKGGHLPGEEVHDLFVTPDRTEMFSSPRIETLHTHGTGCVLASAIATGLAQGLALRDSVLRARAFVRAAILCAPGLGKGHGPLGFGHTVRPFDG